MRAGADNFTRLVDYQDGYASGMRRFDTSLRANPSDISMLGASVDCLLEWQPEQIRACLLGIERTFVEQVQALGLEVADGDDRAANIFGLRMPPGLEVEACRAVLAARKIHVSVRGSAIRISPHVYNDAADLAKLAEALELAVASR